MGAMPLPLSPFDLSGRVALVTGGNGGIGLGMARGLAAAGASLVLAARDQGKLEEAAAEIEGAGGRARTLVVDVTDEMSVQRMIDATLDAVGRIDVLVANAGMNIRKPPESYTLDEWRAVLDANLTGVFLCARAVHPVMKRVGGGKIITVGSLSSLFGLPFAAPYGAAKGGVVQLTKALACAWAADHIQVNAILPGFIDTELTVTARSQIPSLQERVVMRTPEGRWGRPEDLSGVAVFLASAASDFVTGVAIPVDGGYSAQGSPTG
jgi:2-deoxy-D-gluconate 3-dehydrogenase